MEAEGRNYAPEASHPLSVRRVIPRFALHYRLPFGFSVPNETAAAGSTADGGPSSFRIDDAGSVVPAGFVF